MASYYGEHDTAWDNPTAWDRWKDTKDHDQRCAEIAAHRYTGEEMLTAAAALLIEGLRDIQTEAGIVNPRLITDLEAELTDALGSAFDALFGAWGEDRNPERMTGIEYADERRAFVGDDDE